MERTNKRGLPSNWQAIYGPISKELLRELLRWNYDAVVAAGPGEVSPNGYYCGGFHRAFRERTTWKFDDSDEAITAACRAHYLECLTAVRLRDENSDPTQD